MKPMHVAVLSVALIWCHLYVNGCVSWCRYTLEELQAMVETASNCVPGVDAAIAAAIERKDNPVCLLLLLHTGFLLSDIQM